jgi:hypothetical protein
MLRMRRHFRTRRLKAWIERWSGLALADAVNVSIFVLTIVSLMLAAAGVGVAYLTLLDAHESGIEEENNIKAEVKTLHAVQQGIENQESVLSKSLDVSRKQQEATNASVDVARKELETLKQQTALQSALPEPKLVVGCQSIQYPERNRTKLEVYTPMRLSTVYAFLRSIDCNLSIKNIGKITLQGGYLRVQISGVHMNQRHVADQERALFLTGVSGGDGRGHSTAGFLDILQNRPILPAGEEGDVWRLSLLDDVNEIYIACKFGGANFPEREEDFTLEVRDAKDGKMWGSEQ